jgi:hypothetical protein
MPNVRDRPERTSYATISLVMKVDEKDVSSGTGLRDLEEIYSSLEHCHIEIMRANFLDEPARSWPVSRIP